MNPLRRHTRVATPLGDLIVVADADAIVGAYFDGQKYQPDDAWFGDDVTSPVADDSVLSRAASQLDEYFAGDRTSFDLPLAPIGTDFQKRVWHELLLIAPGTTSTYGAIASALSKGGETTPGLAQGVGQAVGHNPISIIVPCHRVIGADGSLTGFAGGLERKRWLLAHEESDEQRATRLF